MKWYKKLYLGENAEKSRYKVFGRIRMNKFSFNTYLIVLPSNKENILDIISANMLLQPYFKKKENRENLYVLGIADGKDEALEVVRTIIDEVYTNTETNALFLSNRTQRMSDDAANYIENNGLNFCYVEQFGFYKK